MSNFISYFNAFIASWARARFGKTERGASLVEYVLLVSLIAVVCIGAIGILGGNANDTFTEVGDSLG